MVGSYELLEEIARGGMGVVYRARDPRSGRIVAVKVMRGDLGWGAEEAVYRFRREAEAGAILHHPHIVPIFESGMHEQRPYLVMEYVEGGRIDRQLGGGPANVRAAVTAIEKVARALHYAHQQGILHRDIKPANVLLDQQGEPRLADFGLAKLSVADMELTRLGDPLGTPGYMAPEQAAGSHEQVGPATEVWALGVLLFELLTGQKPFPGNTDGELREAVEKVEPRKPRTLQPHLDAALESIVLKCLRKEPARRYPSVEALANDLQRWLQSRPLIGVLDSVGCRGLLSLRLGILLLLFALSVGLLLWFAPGPQAPERPLATPDPVFEQLARGQCVELLSDDALPPWHRWAAGTTSQLRLHPLTLEGFAPLLLELLPRAPAGSYRIEVDVSCESIEMGDAGLFFAHHQAPEYEDHQFLSLSHARSQHANQLILAARRYGKPLRERGAIQHSEGLLHWPLPAQASQSSRQQLAVEVSAEQIVAYWQGARIGAVPRHKVDAAMRRLNAFPPSRNVAPAQSLSGPLGAYLRGGRGSFRSLKLSPTE